MSFVDRKQDPRRRANAIIAVGVIHAGLAYVVVTGLGAEIVRQVTEEPFIGEQITLPPPPPEPTAKEQPKKEIAVYIPTTPLPPLKPAEDWKPTPLPPETSETTWVATGGETTELPAQPLPQRPTFTPKRATPTNRASGWITNDDYPRRALVDEAEGSASYSLVIGTNGRVASCELTSATGNRALDDATCRLLTSRARFDPATDESGAKVMGTYTGSVRWQIPD